MTHSAEEMLDLTKAPGRAEKVVWKLLDRDLTEIGTLHPTTQSTMSNSTEQSVKRRINGFELLPGDVSAINTNRDRVQPIWTLSNGATFPCGIFLWASESTYDFNYGIQSNGVLVDQGIILEQGLQQVVTFTAGRRVVDCVAAICDLIGISNRMIDSIPTVLGGDVSWPAGEQNTYGGVCTQLLANAPCYDWYFDNYGKFRVRSHPQIDEFEPVLVYEDGGRIVDRTIVRTKDLNAPNRYIGLDTNITDGPVLGTYDIPDTAENSFANTGYYRPKFVSMPGIGQSYAAYLAAKSAYEQDRKSFETYTFGSTADPRHDTFDVIRFRGVNYLETAWSLPFETGSIMTHEIKKVEQNRA